jgi:hypothetical protein
VSIVLRGSNFALRKTVFRTCDRRNLGAAFALSSVFVPYCIGAVASGRVPAGGATVVAAVVSIFVLRADAASGKGPQFTIVVKRVAVTYADLGRSAVTSVVSAAVAKQVRRRGTAAPPRSPADATSDRAGPSARDGSVPAAARRPSSLAR